MKRSFAIYRIATCFAALFFIGLALWTNKFFGKVTFDQALSTFYFNLQGSIEGDSKFTRRFIEWCVFWPAVVTFLMMTLPAVVRSINKILNQFIVVRKAKNLLYHHFPLALLIVGIGLTMHQYSMINYIRYHFASSQDFIAENYIKPNKVNVTASHHTKSLLLIYVESLEATYSDTNLFRNDLLQRLTRLQTRHVNFNDYEQVPGTSWSIAGIVSTQCSVPLKVLTMQNGNNFSEDVSHFLPGATCLSDILAQHGYKNIYMNGSDVDFAGVGNFMQDHHYQELYGKKEWLASGVLKPADVTGWGMPDDMLLEQTKIKLVKLIQEDKPFNLTVFTIDTHGLTGQLSKTCAKNGFDNFEGIVECTANMVADLIEYSDQQGWLDKMDIIVIGDHLAMKNLAYKELESSKRRTIFNIIVSKDKLVKNRDTIVHFDWLPTILTALGFDVKGGRLGLGYTALGTQKFKLPAHRIKELKNNIPYTSPFYYKLWLPKN